MRSENGVTGAIPAASTIYVINPLIAMACIYEGRAFVSCRLLFSPQLTINAKCRNVIRARDLH
jgi:hypothetical protein